MIACGWSRQVDDLGNCSDNQKHSSNDVMASTAVSSFGSHDRESRAHLWSEDVQGVVARGPHTGTTSDVAHFG